MNPQKKDTNQDGMRAALVAQKYVPSIKETTKDGNKETRHLVLKGDFHILVEGQQKPVKLPCKLEFKDEPSTVQLVQKALNIEDTGEKCLLVIYSNRQNRLDKFLAEQKALEAAQELKFASPKDEESDEEE